MYETLNLFQTSAAMAKHAGARQAVIAQNVAHADTPGYRAREMDKFSEVFTNARADTMRSTRSNHIKTSPPNEVSQRTHLTDSEPAPNGNTVSIEEEMLNAISATRDHDRALAIYRHGMTVLRTALGR